MSIRTRSARLLACVDWRYALLAAFGLLVGVTTATAADIAWRLLR